MKYQNLVLFFWVSLFWVPGLSQAYAPTLHTVEESYEPVIMDSAIATKRAYMGELTGDPHMYEFTIGEAERLTLSLLQAETDVPLPLALIVVGVQANNRGVVEQGRLTESEVVWKKRFDSVLGLSLLESQPFTVELASGTYRVEVSTAENTGKYLLLLGNSDFDRGYFAMIGDIGTIQRFFGASPVRILFSTYVYLPLGIFLVGTAFFYTWRRRADITNHA